MQSFNTEKYLENLKFKKKHQSKKQNAGFCPAVLQHPRGEENGLPKFCSEPIISLTQEVVTQQQSNRLVGTAVRVVKPFFEVIAAHI